ncbi:tRNA dihydrouridine synthase DusB [Bacillota bacterium]
MYSEMISAKGLYYDGKRTEELLNYCPEEEPVAYQIFGSDPAIMGLAVERLSTRGNAAIDVNMGCPVPKVVKNGEGSALMKDPLLAARIIKSMVEAENKEADRLGRENKPITVKCRLGWDKNSINLREFALRAEDAGASALAVHGRTREQMYGGKANWDAIGEIKLLLSIPVIGNGDVFTGEEGVKMLKETGCDFVMIARGALGNPWIFKSAQEALAGKPSSPITAEEKQDAILRHIDMVVEEKGQLRGVQEMRKHVGWYLKGLPGAAEIRRKVNNASTVKDLRDIIKLQNLAANP